jgi:hypothetical protein
VDNGAGAVTTTPEEIVLDAFAAAVWAKVAACARVERGGAAHRRLLESISDDIKKCTDLCVPRVSEAARAEAARLGVDLTCVGWHDQPRSTVVAGSSIESTACR